MSEGKAILIIDMPDNCYECPLCYDNIHCRALVGGDLVFYDRPSKVGWSDLGIDLCKQRLPHCPLVSTAILGGITTEYPENGND